MGNSLMIYLNKRLKEQSTAKKSSKIDAGPVITISREVGCNGLKLAKLITERLNKKPIGSNWKVLSKEIFYKSAKELNLDPEKVRKTFKQADKYTFDQILKAFGDKNYKSERKIAKTVIDVIRSFAMDGFCIIVGRAGHIIASDIENALHIRLTAPLDYRINTIRENNGLTHGEAKVFIEKVEKERKAFRKTIREESLHEELFDITLNRASFGDDDIVDIIEAAYEKKHIFSKVNQEIDLY